MNKKLHILIPTDFSDESEYGIKAGLRLKEYFDVTFSMLHVMPINSVSQIGAEGVYTDTSSMHTTLRKEMREQALTMIDTQSKKYQFELEHKAVLIGPISSSIVEYAEEMNIDLIIMGSKKQKSIVSWFGGSGNQIVARQSSIPVLSVTRDKHDLNIKKLLYIHNLHRHPLTSPHPILLRIKQVFDAKMDILYINGNKDNAAEAQKNIKKYIEHHHLGDTHAILLNEKNVKDAIDDFDMEDYDLISLGTHGRGILSQLFQQSVAEHIIEKADKAILTFRI